MSYVKPRLLQRFRAVGATVVTFFAAAGALADPVGPREIPASAQQQPPSVTLISPLDGLWDQLETVEPSSPDLLTRLRYGFSLDPVRHSRIDAERKWFV